MSSYSVRARAAAARASDRPSTGTPSLVRCFALLMAVRAALLLLGFGRTYRIAQWLTRGRSTSVTGCLAPVRATAERVSLAAAFFPGRALCLEQSLAIFFLLRRAGIEASLRLGVQAYPFAAHAWVEHAGAAVNEQAEELGRLVPFARLPEWRS